MKVPEMWQTRTGFSAGNLACFTYTLTRFERSVRPSRKGHGALSARRARSGGRHEPRPVALTFPDLTITSVKPVILQHEVMYQLFGTTKPEGGLNSTLVADLSILPGGVLGGGLSIDLNFKVFIHKGGSFAYWVVPEANP